MSIEINCSYGYDENVFHYTIFNHNSAKLTKCIFNLLLQFFTIRITVPINLSLVFHSISYQKYTLFTSSTLTQIPRPHKGYIADSLGLLATLILPQGKLARAQYKKQTTMGWTQYPSHRVYFLDLHIINSHLSKSRRRIGSFVNSPAG